MFEEGAVLGIGLAESVANFANCGWLTASVCSAWLVGGLILVVVFFALRGDASAEAEKWAVRRTASTANCTLFKGGAPFERQATNFVVDLKSLDRKGSKNPYVHGLW